MQLKFFKTVIVKVSCFNCSSNTKLLELTQILIVNCRIYKNHKMLSNNQNVNTYIVIRFLKTQLYFMFLDKQFLQVEFFFFYYLSFWSILFSYLCSVVPISLSSYVLAFFYLSNILRKVYLLDLFIFINIYYI